METRINELEAKLAFAEDLLEELNKTAYRQQQQIDLLQKEVRELRKQVAASTPHEPGSLRDEIPPHY